MYHIKAITLLIISIFLTMPIFAQMERGPYCSCKPANTIKDLSRFYQDTVYAICHKSNSELSIDIINTTVDTLYIFKSYLDKQFLSSKYLHRINERENKYKLSLLPLVPFVATKYADAITDNPIVGQQQVVYDFYKLPPNSLQHIVLSLSDIFQNKDNDNNVSKDYDVKSLHKYSPTVPQDFLTLNKVRKKYHFGIEFAIYKSVNLLCTEAAYYLQESEFDKQSKDFVTLTVPVKLNKAYLR